ncbi:HPr kinase/phosphorylase [Paracoccus ravus]|uniref:HPr kinase/phosphorylase n=1 Tax=Paracoccus ravus TaxID=2447760 RepID=UPI00106EF49C|nr:HPr kinase/phosphatase C-terminal domain-containing protein [Paracoccus ravus]
MGNGSEQVLHASCVALDGKGLLILGASGAGKSSLALEMMARGAGLVADDRTIVTARSGQLIADCPSSLRGRIEARGIGILQARPAGPVALALAVDLDRAEPERLPPHRKLVLLDLGLPLVLGQGRGHLASALLQYLVAGRGDPDET